MADYTTKFSLRETAYLLNKAQLDLIPVVITDIYVHMSSSSGSVSVITYKAKYATPNTPGKTVFRESELFYLEQGKAEIQKSLSDRAAVIEGLR